MATGNGNVEMMVSVLPGTMTGFASLNAGLASINNSFLNMTQAISDNFGMVDAAILSTGVVIAQVASNAINAFADFEQSMKIVQMVSGQTADDISYLGQKANEFAIQYRVDIDSITEGLQTLGRAGLNSASEQTEVLQNGLNTAKLEGRELNSVLQELIQNTALLGGDLKSDQFGEQSEYVNNLMVATSLNAPINTHDISETLKYSGGIAAAAGANIESEQGKEVLTDYMAAIAAFARKGVSGSIAGTALRAFFNKPATQDSSVLEALATIKLKPEYLWEDDEQTMKPISEQIQIIQNAMDKMNVSTMDRLQLWSKIVGGKMGQQMMKLDSNDIKEINHDIKEAESANSLATKSMQTFKSAMNEVGQEGQRAFRNFGSTLVFILNPALQVLKQIVHLFNNPIGTSALAVGLFTFFRAFISRVRQVIGGFTQGLRNIWNDYTSDSRHSIRFYRGEVDEYGNKIVGGKTYYQGSDKTSSKQQSSTVPLTEEDRIMKKTNRWSKPSILSKNVKDIFPNYKQIEDRTVMQALHKAGLLSPDHYDAIKTMKKPEFIKKFGREMEELYALELNNTTKASNNATIAINRYNAALEAQALIAQQSAEKQLANMKNMAEKMPQSRAAKRQSGAERARAAWEKAFREENTHTQYKPGTVGPNPSKPYGPFRTVFYPKNYGDISMNENIFEKITGIPMKRNQFESSDESSKGFSPSKNIGQSALITTREEINKIRNDAKNMTKDYEDAVKKETILNRNRKNAYGTSDPEYIPSSQKSFHQSMYEAAEAERRRLALIEQEYLTERQIADTRAAEKAKQSQHVGSKGLITSREDIKRLQDESAKQHQETQKTKPGKDYISSSAKHNASSAFEKGAKDTANNFVQTSKSAAKDQMKANNWFKTSDGYKPVKSNFEEMSYLDARKAFFGGQGSRGTNPLDYNQGAGASFYALTPEQQRGDLGQEPGFRQNFRQQITGKVDKLISKVRDIGSTFRSQFAGFLTKDRSESTFAFANKGLGKFGNSLLNLTDLVGGPVMAAMMLIPMIIQAIQGAQQEYNAKMQELTEKLDDAYEKLNTAESQLKQAFKEGNPDLDENGISDMIADVYIQIGQDMNNAINNGMEKWIEKATPTAQSLPQYEEDEKGNLKEKEEEKDAQQQYEEAVNENTKAIYQAIFEIQNATSKYLTAAQDGVWGLDGFSSQVSDLGGYISTHIPIEDGASSLGKWGPSYENSGNEFLLTASQKSDDYQGYKEMAGLFLEDWKDANGDWIAGLRIAMGDSVDDFSRIIPQATQDFLSSQAQSASRMGPANNALLQSSMKRDKKTWQSLAKEIAKEERKTGKPLDKSVGAKTQNKKLEGLVERLRSTMSGKFDRTQILQAAYLQQMQDMYQVAQQVFSPLLQQAATSAAGTWLESQGIKSGTANTVGNTGGTVQVTSTIAAMVAIIARQSARGAFYDAALQIDPSKADAQDKHLYDLAQRSQNADDFYKKVLAEGNAEGNGPTVSGLFDGLYGAISAVFQGDYKGVEDNLTRAITGSTYGVDKFAEIYEAQAKQVVYGYDAKTAQERAAHDVSEMRKNGFSHQDMLTDIAKNYQDPRFLGAIEAAYEASGIGEDDGGSSGGGGGSGGGDSDDKDKGTKKERVDLVLCNKKEIPKLNVNLFKKPPSFTVLNKNFKLRDIKVNTQDKPKAVLSSIKNAIIDVQKRSDPKIIQDESAEYDPVSASEGSSVPSGSTNTATD